MINNLVLHRIEIFSKKYQNRTFDQDDVMLLLIDLRDTSPKNSLVRELGDFFAHPHGRNKGITWDILNDAYTKIIDNFEEAFNGNFPSDLSSLCTEKEILENVCNAIESAGVNAGPMKNPINDDRAKDFILCLICLLSSFSIIINETHHPLDLSLGRDGTYLVIIARIKARKDNRNFSLTWPILSTSCRISQEHLGSVFPWSELQNFVTRRMNDGNLSICRLETDKNNN